MSEKIPFDCHATSSNDLAKKYSKTRYERAEKMNKYWCTDISGNVVSLIDTRSAYDNNAYRAGNYTTDESLGIARARKTKLIWEIERFSAEHKHDPSYSDKNPKRRYYLYYDPEDKRIKCKEQLLMYEDFGKVYFYNRRAAQKAIEVFEEDLLWYFTEFQKILDR